MNKEDLTKIIAGLSIVGLLSGTTMTVAGCSRGQSS